MFNIYEIYTNHPITGESGWDIEFIVAFNAEDAATFPTCDEVIMKEGSMSDDKRAVLNSGLPLTEAVYQAIYGVAA